MKRTMLFALAALLLVAALPAHAADRGVYMQPNVGWAQKGLPGVIERFNGDMEAVAAYITSELANQQGAGVSSQQRVVAVASAPVLPEPTTWQEWLAMYAPEADAGDVRERPMSDDIPGGAYFLCGGTLYHNSSDDPIELNLLSVGDDFEFCFAAP